MSLLICLITVHPAQVDHYYEAFAFLGQTLRVVPFDRARNYNRQSDNNPEVPREILKNTKTCISMGRSLGNDYVLVLQEDVVFTDNQRMADSIATAVTFMDGNPAADMFMFGTHPFSFHSASDVSNIVKFSYAFHWQAVLFRVSSLDKFGDLPGNTHADLHFARMMRDRIGCYGLRVPVARQKSSDRMIRKYEYDLLYQFRCKFPYGDPLPVLLVVSLLVLCSIALS